MTDQSKGMVNVTGVNAPGLGKLAKPVEKLIDTVAAGCGAIWGPIGRVLDAKAETIVQREAANRGLQIATIEDRARASAEYAAIAAQETREQVVARAIANLPEEVSEEEVDPDWTMKFFSSMSPLRSEELQELWGRVLAKKVAAPREVSMRTVAVLRDLDRSDAIVFAKICGLCVQVHVGGRLVSDIALVRSKDMYVAEELEISYSDLVNLEAAGLIQTSATRYNVQIEGADDDEAILVGRGNARVQLPVNRLQSWRYAGSDTVYCGLREVSVVMLTRAGQELARVADVGAADGLQRYLLRVLSDYSPTPVSS